MNLICQVCGYQFNVDYYEPDGKCPCCELSNCLSEGGLMEETRIIERVGGYSTINGKNPGDCIICHNAKMGTILVDGICLDCLDILSTRKVQIEKMLSLMCDPENQPHQFMEDEGLAYDEMFFK
jgi:hypothetical protein